LAAMNPDINYVGIEKYSSVLLRAVEKQDELQLPNLRFIRMDAENICEVFGKYEVDRIYLNFSDPWPKDRHAKRRLTSRQFFARYNEILKPDGRVEFKTDNMGLFDFSEEEVKEAGWTLCAITRDLHNNEEMVAGNVMTEYEEKFSSMGNPICKLIASRGI
ncbi:MAG: tRNA (guanosine(46)-N7)-methyltransferase TrmB, partial [Lachnospira sp.]|nr:tRNA (guanosine(46)-N7)-methyltransferase TrmB [Lachnospira sp.]